jgi:hypothetical protein
MPGPWSVTVVVPHLGPLVYAVRTDLPPDHDKLMATRNQAARVAPTIEAAPRPAASVTSLAEQRARRSGHPCTGSDPDRATGTHPVTAPTRPQLVRPASSWSDPSGPNPRRRGESRTPPRPLPRRAQHRPWSFGSDHPAAVLCGGRIGPAPLISPIRTAQITALSERCACCAVRRVSASRQVAGQACSAERLKAAERVTASRWSAATRAAAPGRT